MQLVASLLDSFLESVKACLIDRDPEQVLALNMPDDISGWGLMEEDEYNSRDQLYAHCTFRTSQIIDSDATLEVLNAFGNGYGAVIICQHNRTVTLHSGKTIQDKNLRLTFYVVEQQGSLKIPHAHLSRTSPPHTAFTPRAIPNRNDFGQPTTSIRLDDTQMGPFIEHLQKRQAYTEASNLEGLISLHHPSNSNVFWPLQGSELRGLHQYIEHLNALKAQYSSPLLKYHQPIVFRNQSLACLSAYAESGYIIDGFRQTLAPLRVTYILQEVEGQWLCRHSHWSMPIDSAF